MQKTKKLKTFARKERKKVGKNICKNKKNKRKQNEKKNKNKKIQKSKKFKT